MSKCEPLAQAGAQVAESAAAPVEASDVIAVCVIDYDASDALLRAPEVEAKLKGKVVSGITKELKAQLSRTQRRWRTSLSLLTRLA